MKTQSINDFKMLILRSKYRKVFKYHLSEEIKLPPTRFLLLKFSNQSE